jgi:predicted CoA-binding protein
LTTAVIDDRDVAHHLLRTTRVWAVVGCSPNESRASHEVAAFLLEEGYDVIPVNPYAAVLLGRPCYPTLADIPDERRVEVVDIFRRSDLAGAHVDEAIATGAQAVWLQLGVIDELAAARARAAGLAVVMDRCPKVEHGRLAG